MLLGEIVADDDDLLDADAIVADGQVRADLFLSWISTRTSVGFWKSFFDGFWSDVWWVRRRMGKAWGRALTKQVSTPGNTSIYV